MKTMKNLTVIMAALVALCAAARDRLYIENFSVTQGQTLQLPVMLSNDTAYTALQTDLYLPAGIEALTEDDEYVVDLTSRKDPTHTVSTNRLDDGGIRIYVTSQALKTFVGNSGAVMTVTIKVNSAAGNAPVALRNSKAVEPDGTKHPLDDCVATAIGGPATATGDVTGDGKVDIADVNAVINIMLGKAPRSAVADVTGDGSVDIGDVNTIINIMLGK